MKFPMKEFCMLLVKYESEYDREFRTILEGQDQIRMTLTNIDRKMVDLLGRIERLSMASGGQQQISGQVYR